MAERRSGSGFLSRDRRSAEPIAARAGRDLLCRKSNAENGAARQDWTVDLSITKGIAAVM